MFLNLDHNESPPKPLILHLMLCWWAGDIYFVEHNQTWTQPLVLDPCAYANRIGNRNRFFCAIDSYIKDFTKNNQRL